MSSLSTNPIFQMISIRRFYGKIQKKANGGNELLLFLYFFKAVWEESLGNAFGGLGQGIDEYHELIKKAVFWGICNLW